MRLDSSSWHRYYSNVSVLRLSPTSILGSAQTQFENFRVPETLRRGKKPRLSGRRFHLLVIWEFLVVEFCVNVRRIYKSYYLFALGLQGNRVDCSATNWCSLFHWERRALVLATRCRRILLSPVAFLAVATVF